MEGGEYIDLKTLQETLKEGLEELFPGSVWVRAEISSVQVKSNGHCYLDLCQTDSGVALAKAKAVIWRNRYLPVAAYFESATGSPLQAGMQILARVQVNYSELYGLSLIIDEIEPEFTVGQAQIQREKTIAALREDGLLDAQRSLTLPPLPYRLAVISARDAAGYGDFCRHLEENEYGFRFSVTLFEATMQGNGAPASIAQALEQVQTSAEPYDAVLLLRGGGSNFDLSCFDDYSLCFAIANCTVPVFTAIGHDRDHHVADMVAYDSVKTPTALADLMLECYMAEDERLSSYDTRLRLALGSKISAMESRIALLESRIKAADPRSILSRGYTLVTDPDGVVLKSASGVKPGDEITVYLNDGLIKAKVL